MSTWTWTYVRIDKLTDKQINGIIEHALKYGGFTQLETPFEDDIKERLKQLDDHYDYLTKDCGVPTCELTHEYLTEMLRKRREDLKKRKDCYDKVIEGSMAFSEMLEETGAIEYYEKYGFSIDEIMLLKRGNLFYAKIRDEIFRNRKYTEEEFSTVDRMIEFLRTSDQILDFDDDEREFGNLTPQLEKKIREYYGKIGDHNFIVHFG